MEPTMPAPNAPAKILVVEDSATQAQRLRHSLEQQGYEVGIAGNGRLALQMLPRFRPDLIISDVNMPEMDGYELSTCVKARADFSDIPVILVTTMSDPQDVIRGLECGADNFVLKPYDERYLLSRVRYVLVNREMRRPQDVGMGVEIYFNDRRHFITADRLQILNLLLSTYDAAIQRNRELGQIRESLEKHSAEIGMANGFLDSVVENIPDMIFVKDAADLRFVRVNRAGEELLGYSRDELHGKNDYDFFPQDEAEFFTAKDREVLAGGEVGFYEEPVHTRHRGICILQTKKLAIRDEAGQPRYLLGISRDVTETRRLQDELQQRNEELTGSQEELRQINTQLSEMTLMLEERREAADAANRAKSTFLATMSHEIRTPMNGMLGMLELLGLSGLNSEQHTILDTVRESSKSLLRIIDDILDFSMMEAGKLKIRPEITSIKQVIEGVHNIYSGTAASKSLLIQHSVDPRISPALLVDPGRVYQILNNFISNSIKFTAKGGIEIKADLVSRSAGQERIRFSVKDTGIGISPQDQLRLFQPFSQVGDGALAGGTGLGLTICRRLAEMMGGSVEMESAPGEGTTMTLTLSLPVAESHEMREGDRAATPPTVSGRRRPPSAAEARADGTLILLVDDHPINRALLVRQVQALGYASESAEDGAQALEKWRSGQFGLVVTDCHMPTMDGYEFAREVRRIEQAEGRERVPIIACTANVLGGEAAKCFEAGMDDYLIKPVELSQMLKKLQKWRPIPQAVVQSGTGRVDSADVPVDRSLIDASWGGGEETLKDVLAIFRRATHEDAVSLRQAVALGDMSKVTHFAHRMLGAGRMLGALEFAVACERIDHAGRSNDRDTVQAGMRAFESEWARLTAYIDSLGGESARSSA